MRSHQSPSIIICSLHHLSEALRHYQPQHVISILSDYERVRFAAPTFGDRTVLELRFDDLTYSSDRFVAPSRIDVHSLIEFARKWAAKTTMLVHCRAGASRSVAGAAIAAAAVGRDDLIERVLLAKSYFKPNQKMLEIADGLLVPNPDLKGSARRIRSAGRKDEWGPVGIPLGSYK
jgi:predicted protein tyrosine phosphatase